MPSLAQLTAHLARGGKSRGLVEQCLARITDQSGEGRRVFLKVHAEPALAAADYYDRLRARGPAPSPFAGIPLSIKDLFDIAGGWFHSDRAYQYDRVRLLRAWHQSAL